MHILDNIPLDSPQFVLFTSLFHAAFMELMMKASFQRCCAGISLWFWMNDCLSIVMGLNTKVAVFSPSLKTTISHCRNIVMEKNNQKHNWSTIESSPLSTLNVFLLLLLGIRHEFNQNVKKATLQRMKQKQVKLSEISVFFLDLRR